MNELQITHLRAFLGVVQFGSYTKAAEALGYSEPGLHLQVTALRRALRGRILFERQRGQMKLTKFGQRILPLVEHAIADIEQIIEEGRKDYADEVQSLVVGAGQFTSRYITPVIVPMFRQQCPTANVTVRTVKIDEIVDQLAAGDIDIGFAAGLANLGPSLRRSHHQIVTIPVARYSRILAATPSFLSQRHQEPLPVFLPSEGALLRSKIVDSFRLANINTQVQLVENFEAAKSAACASLGVAYLAIQTARLELATGMLRQCLVDVNLPPMRLEVAHCRPVENSVIAKFIMFMRMMKVDPFGNQILSPKVTIDGSTIE